MGPGSRSLRSLVRDDRGFGYPFPHVVPAKAGTHNH